MHDIKTALQVLGDRPIVASAGSRQFEGSIVRRHDSHFIMKVKAEQLTGNVGTGMIEVNIAYDRLDWFVVSPM